MSKFLYLIIGLLFFHFSVWGQNKMDRQTKKAMVYYEKGVEIIQNSPDNVITHEKSEELLNYANKAIKLNPNISEFYRIKGSAYDFQHKSDLSLPCFNKAIQLDSSNYLAWMGRGIALKNKKEFELSEKSYLTALKLNKNSASVLFNLGSLYSHWGKLDKAIETMDKLIQIFPNNALSYDNWGEIFIRKQEYEKAESDFTKAISIDSTDKLAYNNRGFCRLFINKYEGAISDFEKSLKINRGKAFDQNYDTDQYCYNNIAIAYFGLGNKDKACEYWKLAIEKGYQYDPQWKELYKIEDPVIMIKEHCK